MTDNQNTQEQTYLKSESYNQINCRSTGSKNACVEGCVMLYPALSRN